MTGDGGVTEVKQDYEKPRVKDANLQMITPVGLFVVGRFEGGNEGIVWGIQLPQVPNWTFALAWNKKNEEKQNVESPDFAYTNPFVQNLDYMDQDDMNEVRLLTIYDTKDKALHSEQWLDFRVGAKHATGKNMLLCLPQWKLTYDKGNLHYKHAVGTGLGMLAELTKMADGDAIRTLVAQGNEISNAIAFQSYDFPDLQVRNLGPVEGKTFFVGVTAGYDMGKITPEAAVFYATGASKYNEIDAFLWKEYEPQGYRTPRWFNTLLLGEIEDKYYPTLATLGTAQAVNQNDICFHNMTFLKAGATYRPTPKWEIFGQALSAWRTNTKYYKNDYWDMFPLMYALANMTTNASGQTEVPFVFKRKDTSYGAKIDNFLGIELDGRVTYKLFNGLDISLLGGYFKAGDFYEDVLTPKPYELQVVNANTMVNVGNITPVYGPYVGAEEFDLTDCWSVQLKVDFKFKM